MTRQISVRFPSKASANRVNRRLRDYSVLSSVDGSGVVVEIPEGWNDQRVYDLVAQIYGEGLNRPFVGKAVA